MIVNRRGTLTLKRGLNLIRELDQKQLQAAAAGSQNWRARSRLLALARLASGEKLDAIPQAIQLKPETIREWIRRYRADGVDGLRDRRRTHYGRPAKPSPDQRELLATKIASDPVLDAEDLCTWVKTEFGVSHS